MPRVVVLASGSGSLFAELADAAGRGDVAADVVALVTDRRGCGAAGRAEARSIPWHAVVPSEVGDREAWDRAMTEVLLRCRADLVISAGFMRLLGPSVLAAFPQQIINTHPALLPSFPGAHAVREALGYGVTVTGCTIHVVDAGTDTGPVLTQCAVPVLPADDETSLHERIKVQERRLLCEVVDGIARHGLRVSGRTASWGPSRGLHPAEQ